MAFTLNEVRLIGNVGVDPDIRTTKDGKKVASFTLATSDVWRDKSSGELKKRTEWHKIVVFIPALVAKIEEKVINQNRIFSANSRLEKESNKDKLSNYFDENDKRETMRTTNKENFIKVNESHGLITFEKKIYNINISLDSDNKDTKTLVNIVDDYFNSFIKYIQYDIFE
jgi:single stranded DNA-binding protein